MDVTVIDLSWSGVKISEGQGNRSDKLTSIQTTMHLSSLSPAHCKTVYKYERLSPANSHIRLVVERRLQRRTARQCSLVDSSTTVWNAGRISLKWLLPYLMSARAQRLLCRRDWQQSQSCNSFKLHLRNRQHVGLSFFSFCVPILGKILSTFVAFLIPYEKKTSQ